MNFSRIMAVLMVVACIVYLCFSAPPELRQHQAASKRYHINELFRIIANENNVIRTLYTRKIVAEGQRHGLVFDEHWKDNKVKAGPLPALFLRETARKLERYENMVSLFLGSDFPIAKENAFTDLQKSMMDTIKRTGKPVFFMDKVLNRYTAMFPDVAVAPACVNCHNDHPQSPKKNWKLGDVMGATTWSYAGDSVSLEQIKSIVKLFRENSKKTYEEYVLKSRSFDPSPQLGSQWPSEGYFLPSSGQFMEAVHQEAAPQTLENLLLLQ